MIDAPERAYLEAARVGRLATVDGRGRPHAVPVCFALAGSDLVTPIDEKPKSAEPTDLARVRHIRDEPRVSLVVDHYAEDWSALGWVQVRGRATIRHPTAADHLEAVETLREKYHQYESHDLESRPIIAIRPGSVQSWGALESSVQSV